MIKLPSLEWFMGNINFHGKGNRYSGSLGCDPAIGNVDSNIFRYTVWIDIVDEDMTLKAVFYLGDLSYDIVDKSKVTENTFNVNADGILEAQEWIKTAAESFYKEKNGDE